MSYEQKKQKILEQFKKLQNQGPISLKPKATTHFFRQRTKKNKLDLTSLTEVISINAQNLTVEAEALITFHDLTKALMVHGFMPAVVPELRNITLGGAVSGLGVESSSFKFGLVHDCIIECEVLTGNGEIITCSRGQNSDLFYALPNSLGSLGYILKATYRLQKIKPFVHLKMIRYSNVQDYFDAIQRSYTQNEIDFVDGVIFSQDDFVLITGIFVADVPNQTGLRDFSEDVLWQFLENKENTEAYVSTWNYIWRWDTDTFWTFNTGIIYNITTNKLFRKTLGKHIFNSALLAKLGQLKITLRNIPFIGSLFKDRQESILQDFGISVKNSPAFLEWYWPHVGLTPLWVCPVKQIEKNFILAGNNEFLIDLGIYGPVHKKNGSDNYYSKLLEEKNLLMGGVKGLYSVSYFSEKEFWSQFDHAAYKAAKAKYDTNGSFPDLFKKAVGRNTL